MSNWVWLAYELEKAYKISPLSYDLLQKATTFVTDIIKDGIAAISGNSIRIIRINQLG